MQPILLQAAEAMREPTSVWFQSATPLIISISCFLVLLIACRTIDKPHVGPKMPLGPLGPVFNDISLAGFLAAMSFGHILGTLAVLGFAR